MIALADPLALIALLMLLLKGERGGGGGAPAERELPAGGEAKWEKTSAPWPQVVPGGLPKFPSTAWEYDEPPPKAVQQRAGQLVSPLWKQGAGAFKIELTGGRWIAYRAEKVRSGKQGVVAYRQKKQKPAAAGTASAPPAAPAAPETPAIPSATAQSSVQLKAGKRYAYVVKLDTLGKDVEAADIARGLAAAGATNIQVEKGPPIIARYQQVVPADVTIQLNRPIRVELVPGKPVVITILSVKEVKAQPAPAKPKPKLPPDILVSTAPVSPLLTLRDLKQGDGMLPQDPVEEVRVVQRRLGINADGRFGNGTREAVIRFQVQSGLAPNVSMDELKRRGFGAVKKATWEKLFPPVRA